MNFNETRDILKKYDLFAKKGYGQNFLINPQTIASIIEKSHISKDCNVIEIGPGIGTLTRSLAKTSNKVLAYEIDADMVTVLKDTLAEHDNVVVRFVDFLQVNIDKEIDQYFDKEKPIKVVANLPYYITTPILFKLLENKTINQITIMVQKEVGLRLTGKPNTKEYNALSVLMRYRTLSEIVLNVSRKSFYPEPKVESVVLRIETIKNDYNIKNEANFFKFMRAIFQQRRKTLINNMIMAYGKNKAYLEELITSLGFERNIRAEALDVEQIIRIYKKMFEE